MPTSIKSRLEEFAVDGRGDLQAVLGAVVVVHLNDFNVRPGNGEEFFQNLEVMREHGVEPVSDEVRLVHHQHHEVFEPEESEAHFEK